jgi:hypothetical protein
MTKYILIILVSCFGYSQDKVRVVDAQTSEPISYANVWKENKVFTTTDSLGYFINNQKNNPNYKITAIGYNDKYINSINSNISLEPKNIILEEVKIYKPKFLHIEKYGNAKKDRFVGVNFDATTPEFIKFIPNISKKEETVFINSISFYTNTTSKNRKINIIFYSVGQDDKPDKNISTENIICNFKKGKTLNKIDLKKLKVTLPKEGIFIGIQHLLIEDNKYYPTINNPSGKSFCYEPFLSATENPKKYDSWNMIDGLWKINKGFSLNLEIEISD